MGEEAEDILVFMHLTAEEAGVYATVMQRLEAHYVAHRNIIFEKAKFNQRQQEVGESPVMSVRLRASWEWQITWWNSFLIWLRKRVPSETCWALNPTCEPGDYKGSKLSTGSRKSWQHCRGLLCMTQVQTHLSQRTHHLIAWGPFFSSDKLEQTGSW